MNANPCGWVHGAGVSSGTPQRPRPWTSGCWSARWGMLADFPSPHLPTAKLAGTAARRQRGARTYGDVNGRRRAAPRGSQTQRSELARARARHEMWRRDHRASSESRGGLFSSRTPQSPCSGTPGCGSAHRKILAAVIIEFVAALHPTFAELASCSRTPPTWGTNPRRRERKEEGRARARSACLLYTSPSPRDS